MDDTEAHIDRHVFPIREEHLHVHRIFHSGSLPRKRTGGSSLQRGDSNSIRPTTLPQKSTTRRPLLDNEQRSCQGLSARSLRTNRRETDTAVAATSRLRGTRRCSRRPRAANLIMGLREKKVYYANRAASKCQPTFCLPGCSRHRILHAFNVRVHVCVRARVYIWCETRCYKRNVQRARRLGTKARKVLVKSARRTQRATLTRRTRTHLSRR